MPVVLAAGSSAVSSAREGAAPASPPRAAVAQGVPAERATAALRHARRVLAGAATGRPDATVVIQRLVQSYPGLNRAQRRLADGLLARPSDRIDPQGDSYGRPEAARSPSCTADFCVHWVARGADAPSPKDSDGDGIPDFVERVKQTSQRSFDVQNGQLGWEEPRSDRGRDGRRGKTDVFLVHLPRGLFGYAAPDPGQRGGRKGFPRSLFSYLVLDDDYSRAQFGGADPLTSLQATIAHEYNHVLQFSYDVFQDLWFAESSAVWAEDKVFPGADDYLRYAGRWAKLTRVPLTAASIKVYGSGVWNHWLDGRFGPRVVRRAWQNAVHVKPAGFSVKSYGRAIRAEGGPSFGKAFARFAADTAEWRTGRSFHEGGRYPDVDRRGRLPLGATRARKLDHATFAHMKVPRTGGRGLRLRARFPKGIAGGVALVGRLGTGRGGRPVVSLGYSKRGGKAVTTLARPGRFKRVTAVLINADTSQSGFSGRAFDWRYLGNDAVFRARLSRTR